MASLSGGVGSVRQSNNKGNRDVFSDTSRKAGDAFRARALDGLPHAGNAPAAGAPAANQQGQAANTGPLRVAVKAEPSQAEWTKVCGKDPSNNAEICYTTRDFVSDQGQPVLATAVYDVKGPQNQKIVRFLMPLGLLLKPGIRFAVDQSAPLAGTYTMCFPNGWA